MSDFIELHRLLPTTKFALEQYASLHDYDEWLKSFMEPQWVAWLIVLLKAEPDSEELFPHGKWATIQHLEQLLDDEAKKEIVGRVTL